MKILNIILCFALVSCAVKWKNDKNTAKTRKPMVKKIVETDPIKIAEIKYDKPENWANYYYKKTYFTVKNPTVVNTYKQLLKICKAADVPFLSEYQTTEPSVVEYKVDPISIKSKAGFNEKAFVSRGVCRELSLFKSPNLKKKDQFRKFIKSMTLIYIYNIGTYVKDITFGTQYSDVEFYVE